MSQALCENPTCRGTGVIDLHPRSARVCPDCLSRLAETLRHLPVLYARCGELLQGERTRRVPRARGGRREGIVLKDALVEARTEMLSLTRLWAALVVDEARPPRRPRREVQTLVEFLLGYLDWLATHPAIADAFEEFAELHALVQRAIDPGPNRIEVGRCDRPRCGHMVYAQMTASSSGNRLVSCAAGHTWKPHQWLALQQRADAGESAA